MDPKDLNLMVRRVGSLCRLKGWRKDWSPGGCYLHLEASEFIEALRGKGNPTEEAGDVLTALFAMLDHYDISLDDVLASMDQKFRPLETDVGVVWEGANHYNLE